MRWLLALLICGLALSQTVVRRYAISPSAPTSVTYDNSSATPNHCDGGSNPCAVSETQMTYSYTVGAGSNRAIAVLLCVAGSTGNTLPLVSTVTYAAVGLTQKLHTIPAASRYCDIWTMPDGTQPATGTNNVVITLASGLSNSSQHLNSGAMSASGVNQTQQFRTSSATGNSGTSGNAALTLGASTSGDLVVSIACHGTALSSTTQTQRWLSNTFTSGECGTTGGSTATGGTTSLGWTVSGADFWVQVGASWQP